MKDSLSVDLNEIEKFEAVADEWWNPTGKFAPLHKFNPCRINYIKFQICESLGRDYSEELPLKDLNILDIGCGGGLLSEPISNLGANVTAIDASEKNINIAKAHAKKVKSQVNYRAGLIEEMPANEMFDVILNMEVVEHVNDPRSFIQNCLKHLKPGGLIFVATLNRNLKSLLLAKYTAEYILNWVPKGTHDWNKFLKPSELVSFFNDSNAELVSIKGVKYNIFTGKWSLTDDISQNYMITLKLNN